MTTTRRIKIGKVSYAVGFFWSDLGTDQISRSDALKKARNRSELLDRNEDTFAIPYDIWSYPTGKEYKQFGLGKTEGDKKILNCPSLVASLNSTAENICALLPLEGGYWVVGISQGNILASGDSFFTDVHKARQACQKLAERTKTDPIVCQTEEESLEKLKSWLGKNSGKISYLNGNENSAMKFVLLLMILGFASYMAFPYITKQFLTPKPEVLQEQVPQTQINFEEPNLSELFPPVWLEAAPPQKVYQAVFEKLTKLPATTYGWAAKVRNFSAENDRSFSYKTYWKKEEFGSFDLLPPGATLDPKNPLATFSQSPKLKLARRKKRGQQLVNQIQLHQALLEAARRNQISINSVSVQWNPVESRKIKKGDVEKVYCAPWVGGRWEIKNSLRPPSEFFRELNTCPGITLNTVIVRYSGFNLSWTVAGKLYAQVQ